MAANLQSRGLISCVGKRFINYLALSRHFSPVFRRTVHGSVYDKNIDEHVRPIIVPDNVMQVQPDNYWVPHPKTGVFSPVTDHSSTIGVEQSSYFSPSETSVLEQITFFRPLENLEKPTYS